MDIVFLSDYFADTSIGGAALNDEILIEKFISLGNNLTKIKSNLCTKQIAESLKDKIWIISNFFLLNAEVKDYIQDNINYAIIAHDYKFVQHTNPALYKEMLVPEEERINVEFHNKAKVVFCQSILQAKIFNINLPKVRLDNLSGNMWSDKALEFMSLLSKRSKKDCYCVVKSPYWQKGVAESIAKLIELKKDYDLVSDKDPIAFLNKMAEYRGLCMLPKTPETLCRVIVEAKMCGMEVITNKTVGAAHEPWFNSKEIIKVITQKQKDIPWQILARLKA